MINYVLHDIIAGTSMPRSHLQYPMEIGWKGSLIRSPTRASKICQQECLIPRDGVIQIGAGLDKRIYLDALFVFKHKRHPYKLKQKYLETAVAVNFHQLYPQNQQSSCLRNGTFRCFPGMQMYAVFFGSRLLTSTERNFFTPSSGGSWKPFRSDSWEGNYGTKPPISLRQAESRFLVCRICNHVRILCTMARWWFQIFFIFTPIWGRFPFLTNIFQTGWNHQPDGQTPCNMSDVKRWFNRFLQQSNSCPLSIRIFWAHQDLKKSEAFEAFGIPVTP